MDELLAAKKAYISNANNPIVNPPVQYNPINFNDPNANPNVNPIATPPSANPNITPAQPPADTPAPTNTGTGDPILDNINQLGEAQKASKIAGLEKAKTDALGTLDEREGKIKPEFYEKRRQANVTSDNNKRQFAEYLASKGLSSSGLAGQGELNRMSDLSSSIGSFNKQELGAMSDIARDRSGIQSDFAFDKANAEAGVDSQTLASSIDHMERGADRAITEAGLTGTYKGVQTLEGKMAMAGLTGTYTDADGKTYMTQDARNNYVANFGYDPVSGEYSMAYDSTQFNEAMARTESFGKVSAEDAKTLGVKAGTSTLEAKSILYEQAYNIFQSTGVAKGAIAKALGLKEGTTTLEGNNMLYSQAMEKFQTTGVVDKTTAKILDLPVGTMTAAQMAQKADEKLAAIDAAMNRTITFGSVQNDADAKLIGVPKGTKTEQAREAAESARQSWARVKTSSSKTPTTNTKGTTKEQGANYQEYIKLATSKDWSPADIINELVGDPSIADDIGTENYNTWLDESRQTNYNNIINNWAEYEDKSDLINQLTTSADYWKKMLGASRYNTLLGKARAAKNKQGW